MTSCRITIGETRVRITAEEEFFAVAEVEILRVRREIETYLPIKPEFRTSLSPLPDDPAAPPAVRRMLRAARRAGVGPMAAVAGAVAESCLRAMIRAGAEHAVVENGGDIAMILDQPITVGIFTGRAQEDAIALRIAPRRGIIAVCTSSGTVGHSLSFGRADAATVVARDAALADAAATALGNTVRRRSEAGVLSALEKIRISGIEGMLVVAGAHIAAKGWLPEIVRTRIDPADLDCDIVEESAQKEQNRHVNTRFWSRSIRHPGVDRTIRERRDPS